MTVSQSRARAEATAQVSKRPRSKQQPPPYMYPCSLGYPVRIPKVSLLCADPSVGATLPPVHSLTHLCAAVGFGRAA